MLSRSLSRARARVSTLGPCPFHIPLPARCISTRSKLFEVAEEVEWALSAGKPVVALETTIYTHGFPYPENVALASHLESLVRVNGGVPATIGILNGKAHVGMRPEKLIELISTAGSKDTWKISRRDLGFIGGLGGIRGQKLNGGTTISGTMILAHLAGIKVFATGGLGGVHRGGENSMDISADLTELGRTPVAVISSGCKSFLDIPRTLEYLETQGVGVATFSDGRIGDVDFPAFFSRDSGVKSPRTIQSEADAAAVIHAQFQLPVHSGLHFANPVPESASMPRHEIDGIIAKAVAEADAMGITGASNTPHILKRIRELSNNASVIANKALIEANVVRGTKVAVELAKLELADKQEGTSGAPRIDASREARTSQPPLLQTPDALLPRSENDRVSARPIDSGADAKHNPPANDLLVIGSIASDTSCDYLPFSADTEVSPILHTSNPAVISGSAGGVGRNVATAAQYAGAQVALSSVVADDLPGKALLKDLTSSGIDTTPMHILDPAKGARTAQYVAINDMNKDLVLAMGDFSIFAQPELDDPLHWDNLVGTIFASSSRPRWIVTDGNWSKVALSSILRLAEESQIPLAFEPVSTVKASRLFEAASIAFQGRRQVISRVLNIATPNMLELAAMHQAAQNNGFFEDEHWWEVINDFGLSSAGSRDKFVRMLGKDLTDQGVPQQNIRLLPFIQHIVTKLGPQGSLLTMSLPSTDVRTSHPDYLPFILPGGKRSVYMRLFPPPTFVSQHEIVSVNGVGDTLLGVMMAALVAEEKAGQQPRLDKIIPMAQKASILTLKSKDSVSPLIKTMPTTQSWWQESYPAVRV
ncbi:hypothetical protein LTS08_003533 [Lithohypha guttulata]|nr:hypothetical protein LTS08_003533 [Lithohypha guttulata]